MGIKKRKQITALRACVDSNFSEREIRRNYPVVITQLRGARTARNKRMGGPSHTWFDQGFQNNSDTPSDRQLRESRLNWSDVFPALAWSSMKEGLPLTDFRLATLRFCEYRHYASSRWLSFLCTKGFLLFC